MAVGFGAGELFEEVGVLDGGGDLIVAGGPFAEVEDAAAVGAEGEVLVGGEDYFAAGGAEEGFGCGAHSRVNSKAVKFCRQYRFFRWMDARATTQGKFFAIKVINTLVGNILRVVFVHQKIGICFKCSVSGEIVWI
jgi:hypothetical protein